MKIILENMAWFVYIIKCKDGSLYTGVTKDLKRRLREHSRGRGCRYTRYRHPVKLIYSEAYPFKGNSLKREIQVKRLTRKKKLELAKICRRLRGHIRKLRQCLRCPGMHPSVVSGGPVVSKVLLVGQAPGEREPKLGRPFAWTAGKTLFGWFREAAGISEEQFRASIYMTAVCRCFPGKTASGGDRVPSPGEVRNCLVWLKREVEILRPELVIPVGKLAIAQFLPSQKLDQVIGRKFPVKKWGYNFDLIALPHPSGASPWHRIEPGKRLLKKALRLIISHPAFGG